MPDNVDLGKLKEHYEKLLEEHGNDSARSVSWGSELVARRNFAAIARVFAHETKPFSVYEVGCGLGHFRDFLRAHYPLALYQGCDILPEMIERGKSRDSTLQIEVRDILVTPPGAFDYVTVSGLFNLRMAHDPEVWFTFVQKMLAAMYAVANKGIAANFLTDVVDWKRELGYYQNPGRLLQYALHHLSRFSEVRHSYYPWEFTLFTYRLPKAVPFAPPPVEWPPSNAGKPDGRSF